MQEKCRKDAGKMQECYGGEGSERSDGSDGSDGGEAGDGSDGSDGSEGGDGSEGLHYIPRSGLSILGTKKHLIYFPVGDLDKNSNMRFKCRKNAKLTTEIWRT